MLQSETMLLQAYMLGWYLPAAAATRLVTKTKRFFVSQGQRIALLERFRCLGAECEDTCCRGWDMQMNARIRALYEDKAPELLSAVTEGPSGTIMKRDAASDACIKLEGGGLCGIHRERGEQFLGDACYFYPRSTRQVQGEVVQSAALSCPEVARLGLLANGGWEYKPAEFERLPESLRQYGDEVGGHAAMNMVNLFLDHAGMATGAADAMGDILSVSQSLDNLPKESWPEAAAFYLKSAHMRRIPPEKDVLDIFRLLHALVILFGGTGKVPSSRLQTVLDAVSHCLNAEVDWQAKSLITPENWQAVKTDLRQCWGEHAAKLEPVLCRWIQGQVSLHLHPLGGMGHKLFERALLMAVRFAMVKLALVCRLARGDGFSDDLVVSTVQPLARVLDHLAGPELWLALCADYGWQREPRINGVIRILE
jgi:lysine-N-methylase